MTLLCSPIDAAKLIIADYDDSLDCAEAISIEGCQSCIVLQREVRILLIRGSDEFRDWAYNFDFSATPAPGDTLWWHKGFLKYAQIAYTFAKAKGVQLVIGHSLGAAAVQIVATSLGVPGIGFASPRALWAPFPMSMRPENEALVVNYCRADDGICYLPPDGFSHVGTVNWLTPARLHRGIDHGIALYLELLDVAEALA